MATKGPRGRNPRIQNDKEIRVLVPSGPQNPRNPAQGELALKVQKEREIDGVGMGVLSDGTAFLNGRGLAKLCGIDSSRISEMGNDWNDALLPMTIKVKSILAGRGIYPERPYLEIKTGSPALHAYPDVVCLAVLEYYAFDAPNPRDEAKRNFRLLAGKALHDFIYTQVGYDPNDAIPDVWRQFHDRVSLTYNAIPVGYFGVFKEMSEMIVTLGNAGLHIDESFVPDISVGQAWSKHWLANACEEKFGARQKYEHNYPAYFPQADSNPQEPWCYPEAALAEFRRWMRDDYIGNGKFAAYVTSKVRQNALPPSFAQLAIGAYEELQKLPPPKT